MTCAAGVDNLRLKFPGEKSLQFRDLSLSIFHGENVLLLGPSGCGKSTLLQVLTGLIPQSIEVPLQYDRITIPSSWGYVFQDPDSQFCMPYMDEEIAFVLENLRIPREEMPQHIEQYLERVGLSGKDPHTNIQTLSQGMKQRLAIASVLALEPDVLFLDEPTALLDPEGTEQVWQTIRDMGSGKTLIIVEHKIEQIVDLIDRVVLFDQHGHIIADGKKEQILLHNKQALIEYGIWYPGAWNDYVKSREGIPAAANNNPNPQQGCTPIIELKDFAGFRGKEPMIAVPRADIGPAEWIAIVGENGAGKSSLLLALMQLLRTEGYYALHGRSTAGLSRLADELAFVFQNPEYQFVTNSVCEEIAYSLRIEGMEERKITKKVQDMLQFFELTEKKDNHPYQLSIGQKRRLSVAAAIVKEQSILLLDEPTFGQDAKNTFAILEKLEQWRSEGTTILMVTHDMHIVKHYATRAWRVHQGTLAEDHVLGG